MSNANIIHPTLRAWQGAGLKYIYFTSPEALSLHKKTIQTVVNTKTEQSSKAKIETQVKPKNIDAQAKQANPNSTKINPIKSNPAKISVDNTNSNLKLENKILDFSDWSDAWLELYSKTAPSPLVLWTYQEFGEDLLGGTPSPARRKLIAYFLSNLGHSKGTHSFWPTDIPNNPVDPSDASLFWSGVEKLKPRALVVFGEETRDQIKLPPELKAYSNQRINSKYTLLLPSINKLVESPDMVNSVLAFLQRSLAFASHN